MIMLKEGSFEVKITYNIKIMLSRYFFKPEHFFSTGTDMAV